MAEPVTPPLVADPADADSVAPKTRRAAPEPSGEGTTPRPGRPYGGRSLEDRVAARHARFIEAGITLFGKQGFRATTVRGICAEAGLTDRYFYESFDSLEGLLVAVHEALTKNLLERMAREALSAPTLDLVAIEQRAHNAYAIWFEAVSDPRFARIVLFEMLGVSPRVDKVYEKCLAEFAALTSAPLNTKLLLPALSGERRRLIGHGLVGGAVQVASAWVIGGYKESRDTVTGICTLLAMGTLHALAAEMSRR